MDDHYSLVYSEEEMKKFYDLLAPLQERESYFFTLAARPKGMSEEERAELDMPHSEMFYPEVMKQGRKSSYTFFDFAKHVYKFECNRRAFLTNNYRTYPDNSLIVYFDPNPCDEVACIYDYVNYVSTLNKELIDAVSKGSKAGMNEQMMKIANSSSHLQACHPNHHARKLFTDFDFDINDLANPTYSRTKIEDIIRKVAKCYFLDDFYMIQTKGGVHVLVRNEAITFNPQDFVLTMQLVDLVSDEPSYTFKFSTAHMAVKAAQILSEAGYNASALSDDVFAVRMKDLEWNKISNILCDDAFDSHNQQQSDDSAKIYCTAIPNNFFSEAKKNGNCMVPLPGTLQRGFQVKLI